MPFVHDLVLQAEDTVFIRRYIHFHQEHVDGLVLRRVRKSGVEVSPKIDSIAQLFEYFWLFLWQTHRSITAL